MFSSTTKAKIAKTVLKTLNSTCTVYAQQLSNTNFGQEIQLSVRYTDIPCRLGRIRPDETLKHEIIIDRRLFHLFFEGDKVILDSDSIILDGVTYQVESFMGPLSSGEDYISRVIVSRQSK